MVSFQQVDSQEKHNDIHDFVIGDFYILLKCYYKLNTKLEYLRAKLNRLRNDARMECEKNFIWISQFGIIFALNWFYFWHMDVALCNYVYVYLNTIIIAYGLWRLGIVQSPSCIEFKRFQIGASRRSRDGIRSANPVWRWLPFVVQASQFCRAPLLFAFRQRQPLSHHSAHPRIPNTYSDRVYLGSVLPRLKRCLAPAKIIIELLSTLAYLCYYLV